MKHCRYLAYVLRHKWFVFRECCKVGLRWRGITHDLSKFRPSEWIPYANFFHGPQKRLIRDKTGYYKPTDTGDVAFDFAWLLHQKRNDHHWQWWIVPYDDGGFKVFEMSMSARKEMLADWRGAGRAQRKPDTSAWYEANKGKLQLGEETRLWIEAHLK